MAVTPPHSSSSGSGHLGVRSSANYTWHTRDLLGQGASGSVYKAINKVKYTADVSLGTNVVFGGKD